MISLMKQQASGGLMRDGTSPVVRLRGADLGKCVCYTMRSATHRETVFMQRVNRARLP